MESQCDGIREIAYFSCDVDSSDINNNAPVLREPLHDMLA